ncbi:Na/Pi cotransporter family protein [Olivibacter sitiensis]|uniref:Na/Pi cotransporter family protein n=1 Tax=Olivibacter sitiensis TaxID=376470 RepID=UPI000400AF48|nr:Na/Pi symporter [Olivibacter sitiensis]
MEQFQTIILIISAIALFVYGLQNFSNEIENLGADSLRKWIGKLTSFPLGGFLLGGCVTAMVQSSTMVSSLTVSLVNSGIITFRDSLLILLGTNVGTTSTAWIATFQSNLFGPIFIVLGTLISMIPTKIATAGKSIFYFGFIFFSLTMISSAMDPIKSDPVLIDILSRASNPFLGILYGIVITVIIQSSSVVVGLVIVLIAQGVIPLDAAIPIVLGANVGTTSTALLVSFKLSPLSRLTALAASTFNLLGICLLFPFFDLLEQFVKRLTAVPSIQVAAAFTISNTLTSIFFLIFLTPTIKLLKRHRWYK